MEEKKENRIVDLLEPSSVLLDLPAESAADVVKALGDRLFEAGYTKESFVEAALQRESELPTGLPLGGTFNAAIPHTDVEHVIKPGLAMATLKSPVIFQNMVSPEDPVEVQLVFVMALDQPKAQVEMLQQIAGVLQNPDLIERLMGASSVKEVFEFLTVV